MNNGDEDRPQGEHERAQEPVGSVAEEAAKLWGVLTGLAADAGRESGSSGADPGSGQNAGPGSGDGPAAEREQRVTGASWTEQLTGLFHEANAHVATGSEECAYCPVCRGISLIRSTTPEVREHLSSAASSLLSAAAGMLATQAEAHQHSDRRSERHDVEHIDLDLDETDSVSEQLDDTGDWPEEDGR